MTRSASAVPPLGSITVRCYADLADLAGGAEHAVPVGAPRSVKDVVESLGVPHVEVGLLVVDGDPVGFDHLVSGGKRLAVYPPLDPALAADATLFPSPPEPRRFALDVHLGTLARRLRWLGFDTWWANDVDDRELAALAVGEQRILCSRDRGLLMRREVVHGHLPRADDPEVQLLALVARYDLGSRTRPGTRCIRCNRPLADVDKAEVADQLPPRVRAGQVHLRRCTSCAQLYWPGTHLDALRQISTRVAVGRRAAHEPGPRAAPP